MKKTPTPEQLAQLKAKIASLPPGQQAEIRTKLGIAQAGFKFHTAVLDEYKANGGDFRAAWLKTHKEFTQAAKDGLKQVDAQVKQFQKDHPIGN